MVAAAYSVEEVQDFALRLGINIRRLAPSWGWFTKDELKGNKKFASNNKEAMSLLLQLQQALNSHSPEFQIWYCNLPLGLTLRLPNGDIESLPELAVCAPSKAQAIRMLDAHFKCGKGTGVSGFAYKMRRYWKKGWPIGMAGVSHEHGIWEVSEKRKVA